MTTPPSSVTVEIPCGPRRREALVLAPEAAPPPDGWPLVLAFHGGRSHPEMMRRFSGLDVLAASARAVVAFPAGTGSRPGLLTWNAGNCCGEARDEGSDDVAFATALVEALAARLPLDPRRVHATGMSNGAMMAYRLAAERAERIASLAAVAGPLALETIRPSRPVPVLHFHGTGDEFTPWEGGSGRRSVTRVAHRPVLDGLRDWVRADGCPPQPVTSAVPCTDAGLAVERLCWGPGTAGAEVVLYRIDGGGHTWPGRRADAFLLGASALSLDANALIWEFFARHPLPA